MKTRQRSIKEPIPTSLLKKHDICHSHFIAGHN